MSINLIIISRYNSNSQEQNFIDYITNLNLATPENTHIIYPTDTQYETSLIIPYLKTGVGEYNLIIYSWSITLSADINSDISNILTSTFDVAYLGKYLDICNNYSLDRNINNFSLVKGTDPIGFNAALLSGPFTSNLIPKLQSGNFYTVGYAINEYKLENDIIEYATSPNLFVYNPLYVNIDLSNGYSVKTTECQGITSQIIPPSDNDLTIFWIILIVIGIAIIVWFLVNYTSLGKKIDAVKFKSSSKSL